MLGRCGAAALGLIVAALLVGAASAPAAQLESIGTFSTPLSVAAPPGDPDDVYVVEQGGTIQVLVDGVKQAQPFLDITPMVTAGGERGLLSMAFAPDYATTHRFYVYYTGTAPTVPQTGDIEVDQFTASSAVRADAATRLRVLTIPHTVQPNHNGGQLQFGPDGALYASTGDGGGGGDTQGNGQNLSTSSRDDNASPLLGKILRVNPSPGGGYTVPTDNPFVGPAAPVWMLGLRNPWRFSFDRQTGDMIIGDVGQGLYEEIDLARSPGPGQPPGAGMNFGWNLREGLHSFSATNETAGPNFQTDPVIEESHSDGWLAIIGGSVVRDPGLPELAGTYLFGDNAKGRLYGASLATPLAANVRDLGNALAVPGLTGMGEDACGRVYMALLGGEVKRLINDSGGYTCTAALAVAPTTPGGGSTTPIVRPWCRRTTPSRRRSLCRAWSSTTSRARGGLSSGLVAANIAR